MQHYKRQPSLWINRRFWIPLSGTTFVQFYVTWSVSGFLQGSLKYPASHIPRSDSFRQRWPCGCSGFFRRAVWRWQLLAAEPIASPAGFCTRRGAERTSVNRIASVPETIAQGITSWRQERWMCIFTWPSTRMHRTGKCKGSISQVYGLIKETLVAFALYV